MTGLKGWQHHTITLSVALAAAAYLAASLWGGWEAVVAASSRVGYAGLALALLMSLVNYGLRFVRWQAYLTALGHPVHWLPSLRIYLAGFALTTTPGKAGEALRGLLLRPFGVPYPVSFAALFSERLSDLLAILLLTLIGLSQFPHTRPFILIGMLLVASALLLTHRRLLAALRERLPATGGRLQRLGLHLIDVLLAARACHQPALLLRATLTSLVAWGAEAVAFHWILLWMGLDVTLGSAIFIYAIAVLAGALSFMPGGLGSTEAVMVSLLVWMAVPGPDAIAATLIIRLTTLWFAVALGALMLSRRPGQRLEGSS